MSVVVLLLVAFAGATNGFGLAPPPHARGGEAYVEFLARRTLGESGDAKWYTQRLDHFNPTANRTFPQRYYESTAYRGGEDSPLIMYICGEGPCEGLPGGFVEELAKEHQATMLALEHRWFGESVPGGDFSVEAMQLLTPQQVLADLAGFLDWYRETALNGRHVAVLTVGGSWPGALSAWFRIKYPTHTNGSISSSGVVNAVYDFVGFDEEIAAAAGAECAAALRAVTSAFEDGWDGGRNVRALINAPEDMIKPDFFYALADSQAMTIQYSAKSKICGAMVPAYKAGDDMVTAYANFSMAHWGKDFFKGPFYSTEALKTDKTMARPWRWLKCTAVAYLQAAPAEGSIRSASVSLEALQEQCLAVFGTVINNTDAVNMYYGGDHPEGTNILFVNSSDDPWQRASVTSNFNPTQEPFYLIKCDNCGHCSDLGGDTPDTPQPVRDAHAVARQLVSQWLH